MAIDEEFLKQLSGKRKQKTYQAYEAVKLDEEKLVKQDEELDRQAERSKDELRETAAILQNLEKEIRQAEEAKKRVLELKKAKEEAKQKEEEGKVKELEDRRREIAAKHKLIQEKRRKLERLLQELEEDEKGLEKEGKIPEVERKRTKPPKVSRVGILPKILVLLLLIILVLAMGYILIKINYNPLTSETTTTQQRVVQTTTSMVDITTTKTEPEVVCNLPYIQRGIDCCLDTNNNRICDFDELPNQMTTTSTLEEEVYNVTNITCFTNKECEQINLSQMYCSKVNHYLIPLCKNPGTNNSYCIVRVITLGVDGMGGDIPCPTVLPGKCSYNSQCGKSYVTGEYTCEEGQIVRDFIKPICINNTCTNETSKVVIDICTGMELCQTGYAKCITRDEIGSCYDCVKNFNETGVDCDGKCKPCASRRSFRYPILLTTSKTKLGSYTTWGSNGNLTVYVIGFLKPIKLNDCTYGAEVQVKRLNAEPVNLTVTRYENGNFEGLHLNFVSGSRTNVTLFAGG